MEEIIIYQNRKKQRDRILLILGLFLGSAAFIFAGYVAIGIIGIIFFGISLIDITYHVIMHIPLLVLNEKGIRYKIGFGEVLWEEIESFQIDELEKTKRINIRLKNFEKSSRHFKPASLRLMNRRIKMGHEPVSIMLVLTDIDIKEMYGILTTRLQDYKSRID